MTEVEEIPWEKDAEVSRASSPPCVNGDEWTEETLMNYNEENLFPACGGLKQSG